MELFTFVPFVLKKGKMVHPHSPSLKYPGLSELARTGNLGELRNILSVTPSDNVADEI